MKRNLLVIALVACSMVGCRTVQRMAKDPMPFDQCVEERQAHLMICAEKFPDPKHPANAECVTAANAALDQCVRDLHGSD